MIMMILHISMLVATDTATPVMVLLWLMLLRVLDSPGDMVLAHTAAPATKAFLLHSSSLLLQFILTGHKGGSVAQIGVLVVVDSSSRSTCDSGCPQ